MRISDWSSDVCSSDLPDRQDLAPVEGVAGGHLDRALDHSGEAVGEIIPEAAEVRLEGRAADHGGPRPLDDSDRVDRPDGKSVGTGKSGSGGVVLGVVRIFNKQRKKTYKIVHFQ